MVFTPKVRLIVGDTGYPIKREGIETNWFPSQKEALDYVDSIATKNVGKTLLIVKPVTEIFIAKPKLNVTALLPEE